MTAIEDSIVLQCQHAGRACEGCDSVCRPWNKHADCQGDIRHATVSHMPQLPQCHHRGGGEFSNGYYSATPEQRAIGTQHFLESKLQNCAVPELSVGAAVRVSCG